MTPASQSPPIASPKPAILDAIDLTLRTIERRTRLYRNLVIIFSLTGMACFLAGLILRRWIPLVGLLALPFFITVFVYLDQHIVQTWAAQILQMREQRALKLEELEKTLTGFRFVPPATLQGMLGSLNSDEKTRA